VRALTAAGKSWKYYGESLPSAGYTGGDFGNYVRPHNPFSYFSDVQNSATQAANIVPFPQLATDIANNSLPNYGFIIPDVSNDAHSCPAGLSTCSGDQQLAAADQWLSKNIKPLLASAAFQNSLLIIVFDESELTDFQNVGGHVPAVLIGSRVKAGYQSTTFYEHASTLRLMLEGLGVKDLPGAAATATDMGEFFK
jgi:acid phosphatase